MIHLISLFIISLLNFGLVQSRTFTVVNSCSYTIWPALYTAGGPDPNQPTGWVAPPSSSVSFDVDEGWRGRIWGRTDCDFDKPFPFCSTGGCNGGPECNRAGNILGGTGVAPATLAELALTQGNPLQDFYDISAVDGTNIPLALSNNKGCQEVGCPFDFNPVCPAELAVKNSQGTVVGCNSDCAATNSPQSCCSGAFDLPSTCSSSGSPHYPFFKSRCPFAYMYAYDDNNNSLFTCASSERPNYTITFCPGS